MLHPSAHLPLDCGEILWPQRGCLGELDLPVRPGNEHSLDHAAVNRVDTAGARDQGRLTASGRHAADIDASGGPPSLGTASPARTTVARGGADAESAPKR
jgi:hypothetical protein